MINVSLLLSLVFILGPLFILKKEKAVFKNKAAFILYFICLGFAYMTLEVVFMQKFVLFLGHPIYAISVVLSSFLIFSGLGSVAAGNFSWNRRKTVVLGIVAIIVYGILLILFMQEVMTAFLGATLIKRAFISWVIIFPLAFFMGMPFPTGLRMAGRLSPALSSWAIGINGCASVTASVLVIIVAMGVGFSWAIGTGLIIYALALLAFICIKY